MQVAHRFSAFTDHYETVTERLKRISKRSFLDVRALVNLPSKPALPAAVRARMLLLKVAAQFVAVNANLETGAVFFKTSRTVLELLLQLAENSSDKLGFWDADVRTSAQANVFSMQALIYFYQQQFTIASELLTSAAALVHLTGVGQTTDTNHSVPVSERVLSVFMGPMLDMLARDNGSLVSESYRHLISISGSASRAQEIDSALAGSWMTVLEPARLRYTERHEASGASERGAAVTRVRLLAKLLARSKRIADALAVHALSDELEVEARCVYAPAQPSNGTLLLKWMLNVEAAQKEHAIWNAASDFYDLFGDYDAQTESMLGATFYIATKLSYSECLCYLNRHDDAQSVLRSIYEIPELAWDVRCDALMRALRIVFQSSRVRKVAEELRTKITDKCGLIFRARVWFLWEDDVLKGPPFIRPPPETKPSSPTQPPSSQSNANPKPSTSHSKAKTSTPPSQNAKPKKNSAPPPRTKAPTSTPSPTPSPTAAPSPSHAKPKPSPSPPPQHTKPKPQPNSYDKSTKAPPAQEKPKPKPPTFAEDAQRARMCMQKVAKVDTFAFLGTSADVSCEELKRSYRRMATQLHPDKNPDTCADIHFTHLTHCLARAQARLSCSGRD